MTDLTQALAELRRGPHWPGAMPWKDVQDTICNAALSGTLIPRADADLAVALMVEKASSAGYRICAETRHVTLGRQVSDTISTLALASALAELQAVRDELHLMKTAGIIEVAVRNLSVFDYMQHWERRAEAAEAELATLQRENAILRSNARAQGLVEEIGAVGKSRRKETGKLASVITNQRAELRRQAGELDTLKAQVERLTGLVRWAHDTLWELNPSNYGHDDVCKVNDAAVEVILGLAPVIGETHGHSPEWWADRAALTEGAAHEKTLPTDRG